MSVKLQQLYRDELAFLRLQGKDFAKRHPQLSRFLASESSDPDVERLLEGFAFLSARLREKIEDDFPELTCSLLALLWPNYLRPVPSMTMMRFDPVDNRLNGREVVPKDTLLVSEDVDGIPCHFYTTSEIEIFPLCIKKVDEIHSREKSIISISLQTLTDQPINKIGCDSLDLYLSGDEYTALTIYLWVFRYLDKVLIKGENSEKCLGAEDIEPLGFSPQEAILPYPKNVFDGYRIIQEFLSFQRRFYQFRLKRLQHCWPKDTGIASIEFHFNRAMPDDIKIREQDFSLFCAPAVNLFKHASEPVLFDGKRLSYPLLPSNNAGDQYEIFSVEQVVGTPKKEDAKADDQRIYSPFESFQHEIERQRGRKELYYRLDVKASIKDDSLQHFLSFIRSDESQYVGEDEVVSVDLYCTNSALPDALGVGDVHKSTEGTPAFITFTNITKPTPTCRPVIDGSLHWALISNLALNYLSMLEPEPLKNIIRSYDFPAFHDVQAERRSQKRLAGIKNIQTKPIDRLIKGFPVRGLESTLELDREAFLCDGEMYLFGTVLSKFFSLYSSINSFHLLKVHNLGNNEHYSWNLEPGKQPVI
jgi:type VI secretion system protein ImpG